MRHIGWTFIDGNYENVGIGGGTAPSNEGVDEGCAGLGHMQPDDEEGGG